MVEKDKARTLDAIDRLMTDPTVQQALRSILVSGVEAGVDIAQAIMMEVQKDLEQKVE
jgi:hypothetical protein